MNNFKQNDVIFKSLKLIEILITIHEILLQFSALRIIHYLTLKILFLKDLFFLIWYGTFVSVTAKIINELVLFSIREI